MRTVKDFTTNCKKGNYIVRKEVGNGYPSVKVYDSLTGTEADYYGIYMKPIRRVKQEKDKYILYI